MKKCIKDWGIDLNRSILLSPILPQSRKRDVADMPSTILYFIRYFGMTNAAQPIKQSMPVLLPVFSTMKMDAMATNNHAYFNHFCFDC